MRFLRAFLTFLGLGALLLGASSCGPARTANASGVWVTITPSTVTAGQTVQIQATCGDSNTTATVTSTPFGTITLQPVGGLLGASATVPASVDHSTFEVRLQCPAGTKATTTLTVNGMGTGSPSQSASQSAPVMGPNTGGGFLANGDVARTVGIWIGIGAAFLAAAAGLTLRNRVKFRPSQATEPVRAADPTVDGDQASPVSDLPDPSIPPGQSSDEASDGQPRPFTGRATVQAQESDRSEGADQHQPTDSATPTNNR